MSTDVTLHVLVLQTPKVQTQPAPQLISQPPQLFGSLSVRVSHTPSASVVAAVSYSGVIDVEATSVEVAITVRIDITEGGGVAVLIEPPPSSAWLLGLLALDRRIFARGRPVSR